MSPTAEDDPSGKTGQGVVPGVEARAWFVAHTRPRCEKKLLEYCTETGIPARLLCYKSVRKYRGKTVTFEKPLFPGYVFIQLLQAERQKVVRNRHTANLLEVIDQETFLAQIDDIERALDSGYEVMVSPAINAGARVRIREGPLEGMEGLVEKRDGLTRVVLRLDFISQAASILIDANLLELT